MIKKLWGVMGAKLATGAKGVAGAGSVVTGAGLAVGSGLVEHAKKNYLGYLLLALAAIVNVLDTIVPGLTFRGFELDTLFNLVQSQGILGIYDIFHLNLFILIIFVGALALRGQKPNIVLVSIGLFLAIYVGSLAFKGSDLLTLRNSIEVVLLIVASLLLFLKNYTREEYLATGVIITLAYNIWMFGISSTAGGLLHFSYVIIFFILSLGKAFDQDRSHALWWLVVIMVVDFFLVGALYTVSPQLGGLPWLFVGTTVFVQVFQPTLVSAFVLVAIPLYLIISMGLLGGETFRGQLGLADPGGEDEDRWSWVNPGKWSEWWGDSLNRSIYYGSGQDYYAGQVDRNANKDLGVYLEDLADSEREWRTDERIFLYANLKAENADGFRPTTVTLRCSAWRGETKIDDGIIQPRATYEVEQQSDEPIQCVFDSLPRGTYQVRLSADFDFTTEAYLKRYFVTRDRLATLRASGSIERNEDILRLNGITDTNPLAQNTVGPIRIEVGGRVPPLIIIDRQEPLEQLFSSTLTNAWEGTIAQVTGLTWHIPEGLALDHATCRYQMQAVGTGENEKYLNHQGYSLSVGDAPSLGDGRQVIQSCVITADPGRFELLLDEGEVTTRYFWLSADYRYITTETLSITVREANP